MMSTAPKYQPHYTIEDYRHWEGEWELWQGTAVSMSPSVFGGHASAHTGIVASLYSAVGNADCDATVLTEIDWIVSNDTILRPDVTIVCGSAPERHVETPPGLVVEVLSPSTRERDLVYKREMYQEQAVSWYLIVDPEAKSIEALRLNGEGTYESISHADTLAIDICGTCSLSVRVDRIFK